ncbi:hypothetical protein GWI33_003917 [Rhynchophorus ferrugineus]|uniref:Reverse transcriptase n=1 Tax=Rhynchophorus ferrugineus TaxID=354439 RepID=A0A834IXD0_RHYFE|nr:hypothetical protein GWI33_003917 [Rhynchophorus ferrugineus]
MDVNPIEDEKGERNMRERGDKDSKPRSILFPRRDGTKWSSGEAPGTDGILVEVVKTVAITNTDRVREVMHFCLRHHQLPKGWKTTNLVLIQKPGTSSAKRRMLATTVTSSILYATPILGGILRYKFHEYMLERLNRALAIRITSAYRKLYGEAGRVLTGLPPIRLQVEERNKALTGHGLFGQYLHKIYKTENNNCWYCECENTPGYTLFVCPRWTALRVRANSECNCLVEVSNTAELLQGGEEQRESDEDVQRHHPEVMLMAVLGWQSSKRRVFSGLLHTTQSASVMLRHVDAPCHPILSVAALSSAMVSVPRWSPRYRRCRCDAVRTNLRAARRPRATARFHREPPGQYPAAETANRRIPSLPSDVHVQRTIRRSVHDYPVN